MIVLDHDPVQTVGVLIYCGWVIRRGIKIWRGTL